MSQETSPRRRLVDALGSIAGYNDKGAHWARHSRSEIRAEQDKAQALILALVAEIGEAAFSKALLRDLKSGAAVRDGDGLIRDRARSELGEG